MGKIVSAMAMSHAFAMLDPDLWDEVRTQNRARFIERLGFEPPAVPQLLASSPDDDKRRFKRIREAQESLRQSLAAARPDTLIIVGDDQNENLTRENVPQIAIYTGGDVTARMRRDKTGKKVQADQELAQKIMVTGVKRGFDLASLGAFADDTLISHAHVQALTTLFPDAAPKLVLVFLNAIHHPAPEPSRCYAFGKLLADVIAGLPDDRRIAMCGSGGLSHFTAGYPWRHYSGPFTYGSISEDFDRKLMDYVGRGDVQSLADLSSDDLVNHGEIEFRAWVAIAGAVGNVKPNVTVYEPFYRAIMGMGVAAWTETARG
jgi:aromatic ring-opening dioxygenase LigB subunit